MVATRIPIDPEGYSVNQNTGTIHSRYADHGNGLRTRTTKGVLHLLDGKAGKPCVTCYGKNPPYPTNTPRPPQTRRVQTWAQPAEIEVDDDASTPSLPRG
jgi:hypothetical protein